MKHNLFETTLWKSRLFVYLAVIGSMLSAIGLFFMTAVDIYYTLSHLTHYLFLSDVERSDLKASTVAHIVGSVDGFLLAIIMLIFSFGIYELFIDDIQCAQNDKSSKVLIINSLDDLKSRLASVIVMILIVLFFEHAIHLDFKGVNDLVIFGGGIALVSLALYLLHKSHETHHVEHEEEPRKSCNLKH